MNDPITKVAFKRITNPYTNENEIIAIFVNENWDNEGKEYASYLHIGQHGGCDKEFADNLPYATPAEYNSLKEELENLIGYKLSIVYDL